jgi:hypothetical protein
MGREREGSRVEGESRQNRPFVGRPFEQSVLGGGGHKSIYGAERNGQLATDQGYPGHKNKQRIIAFLTMVDDRFGKS